ncbi:MAG: DNA mismatch repair endonuclease MutL [Clostridia bacterium]|nr:DNA mismatch repair endonuclease MutL [Clostridia bacterium]
MGKINVVSFEIANLIAAGEVVERPASVLKELIENSIDSGATEIVAEIKRGGVALIRVTDNGCGMEKEDLPVALKRHATSKIKEKDDLYSIMTLGFRGEALAAIASVSELTIISKTKSAENGTMLTAEGGRVVDISEVGTSDGTTVVVENLFYNVPARRKFLKKDSTEAMNVAALVEKVALSRPDISIQLLVDGEQKFKTPGNSDLLDTVYAVFGREFASKMIKAEGEANGIKVHGYIGRSDNVKKNRNLQNVFINGRYVKSLTAMAAIEKAYTSYIAPECFPTCVLFLEMSPSIVDVNVHPAKLEVKFSDERIVFESVYYTVKTALENHEYRPELTLSTKKTSDRNPIGAYVPIGENTRGEQISFANTTPAYRSESLPKSEYVRPPADSRANIGYARPANTPGESTRVHFSSGVGKGFGSEGSMTPKSSVELLERYRTATVRQDAPTSTVSYPTEEIGITDYKIIGEAFDCYIMVEREGYLLVIDKHAAHERVIFEDLKKSRERDGRIASQSLLLPITAMLTPDEISAAEEYSAEIKAIGYEYYLNGKAADITAIPDAISATDAESLFVKMLDELVEGRGNPAVTEAIRREKALYQIACKAAIKGGRVYDKSITSWIVGKVLSLPDITVCPHGRPIAYKLTKNELDKQFDRIK